MDMIQKSFNLAHRTTMEEHETKLAYQEWRSSLPSMSSRRLWVFFLRGPYHRRSTRFVVVYPLVACSHTNSAAFRWLDLCGSSVACGITSTCRRNRAECEAIRDTRLWCRRQHAVCLFIIVLEVGCRNQSVITHEASSTEAFSSDTHVSAPLASWMARKRSCGLAQSPSGVAPLTRKVWVLRSQRDPLRFQPQGLEQTLQYDCQAATRRCHGLHALLAAQVRAPASDTQPLFGVATKRWN